MEVVLCAHGDRLETWLLPMQPVDARNIVDRVHLARGNQRRCVRREVARQQRRNQHAVLVHEIADLVGEVVAPDHQDELYAVLVDQLFHTRQCQIGLEVAVEGDEIDHEAAHADLDAACGIDAVAPDEAAIEAGLRP